MLFEIKIFFLLKGKQLEYKIKVFIANLAIAKAFEDKKKIPYKKTIPALLVLFVTLFIVVWGVSKIYSRKEFQQSVQIISQPDTLSNLEKFPQSSADRVNKEIKPKMNEQTGFIVVVDKLNKILFVLDTNMTIKQSYPVMLGGEKGNKSIEGDMKTPAGVYKIVKIKKDEELLPMYGPFAFVLNYPNKIDIKEGRTGSGIWIHGTGNLSRDRVTKGCVVAEDDIIIKLTEYIRKDTAIYIYPDGYRVPVQGNMIPKRVVSATFLYGLISNRTG